MAIDVTVCVCVQSAQNVLHSSDRMWTVGALRNNLTCSCRHLALLRCLASIGDTAFHVSSPLNGDKAGTASETERSIS